jgi:hypothetical protein
MTKDKGRGVFTRQVFKKGSLIVIEKAMAEGREDAKREMVC